jgi:hypothetical protein
VNGDIGESLVGAYLRHVEQCSIVTYNSFFADRQGEVDVVGVKPAGVDAPRRVYICEVTTHTGGMLMMRNGKDATREVIMEKLERLRAFADITFPGEDHRYQWWSPYVAEGKLTKFLALLTADWQADGLSLEFIVNAEYTERIGTLIASARANSSTTNEPAYRMLQILTRLRGEKPKL